MTRLTIYESSTLWKSSALPEGQPIRQRTKVPCTRMIVCGVLAAALWGPSSASGQTATARVRIVDSVDLPEDVTTAIGHEIEAIWGNSGVHVDATKQNVDQSTPERGVTLYVLLRDRMSVFDNISRRAVPLDGPIGLAWIPFTGNVAGRVIFVSVENVRQLLGTFSYAGRQFEHCTSGLMHTLMGRALGRVVAHEIGHFLYGAAHSRAGLMKPMLDDFDLVSEHLPAIARPSTSSSMLTRSPLSFSQQQRPDRR